MPITPNSTVIISRFISIDRDYFAIVISSKVEPLSCRVRRLDIRLGVSANVERQGEREREQPNQWTTVGSSIVL
jgi:hypothetical protein